MLLTLLTTALLAAAAALADTCPASFTVHPNGNRAYCLTVDAVHAPLSAAHVRRCGAPGPEFGQLWTFYPFPRNAAYFLRNFVAGTNNLCLNAALYPPAPGGGAYAGRQAALSTCYNDGANDWRQNARRQLELGLSVDGRKVCMDLRDGALDGGAVQIWYCADGNANQVWDIVAHET